MENLRNIVNVNANNNFKKWIEFQMGQNENYRDMKKSKGKLMLADRKKKNLISIHEMLLLAFKYIFWPASTKNWANNFETAQ